MVFWPPSLNPEHSLPPSPPSPRPSMNHSARHLFYLTVGLLLMVVNSARAESQPDPDFHIYLCLGQSNMEGFPGIPDQDRSFQDDRFLTLAAVDFPELGHERGHWYPAVPPLCRPNSGVSPADFFGRTLIQHLPPQTKVGVVSVAVAGAKIEVFDSATVAAYAAASPEWLQGFIRAYDGDPYARLVEMARVAQQDGVIKGILLHQGESNTGDPTWPAQVNALYERLLDDLALAAEEVPLLVGELVHADQNGACASMNEIIATLPELIPTAHVVSSTGAPCHPDRLHFTPEGYRLLGQRYAETLLAIPPPKSGR